MSENSKKVTLRNYIPSEPYAELPQILEQLVSGVKIHLSENLIGIYMVGSLAVGGFDLDSDVDFLVVIQNELSSEDVSSLQQMHRDIYDQDCYPAKHLEGSYIRKELLCNEETMLKENIWYLDNGGRTLELSDHDNRWHVHWMLREKGISLLGQNPKEFVKPIPEKALKKDVLVVMEQMKKGFQQELDQPLAFYNSRFGQSFIILTVCRILHTISTGIIISKYNAVNWAISVLDKEWTELIEQAWLEREGVRFCKKIRLRADQTLLEKTNVFIKYTSNLVEQNNVLLNINK